MFVSELYRHRRYPFFFFFLFFLGCFCTFLISAAFLVFSWENIGLVLVFSRIVGFWSFVRYVSLLAVKKIRTILKLLLIILEREKER